MLGSVVWEVEDIEATQHRQQVCDVPHAGVVLTPHDLAGIGFGLDFALEPIKFAGQVVETLGLNLDRRVETTSNVDDPLVRNTNENLDLDDLVVGRGGGVTFGDQRRRVTAVYDSILGAEHHFELVGPYVPDGVSEHGDAGMLEMENAIRGHILVASVRCRHPAAFVTVSASTNRPPNHIRSPGSSPPTCQPATARSSSPVAADRSGEDDPW